MKSKEEIVAEMMAKLKQLSGIPSVALQVSQYLNEPDADIQHLSELILMDPTLTAQVLRLCNSAEYGVSRRISTVSEAVSIIGHKVLKNIVFNIISHECLNRPIEGYALEKGELWQNAITCGTYAKYIATKVGFHDTELAYVSAILRDIGKILLESYMKGQNKQIEAVVHGSKISFSDAEEHIFGINHENLGAKIADYWRFPKSLVHVIQYHHSPTDLPTTASEDTVALTCVVHIADVYTMMTGTGVGVDGLMYPLDMRVFDSLNLPSDNVYLETLYSELLSLSHEIQSRQTALPSG